jgi:hypothetical protein
MGASFRNSLYDSFMIAAGGGDRKSRRTQSWDGRTPWTARFGNLQIGNSQAGSRRYDALTASCNEPQ